MSVSQAPSGAPLSITPGTILAGKYRVQRILGQGGMGVVVEARHIALEERVALKFLLPEHAVRPEAAERFLREARAAVKIKNEHVARVSDVGMLEGGEPYMVMEYLDGSDLSNLLEKHGAFSLTDAVDYVIQGCEAIAEAHSYGIVHRDLKPANLFLTRHTDGAPLVKVLDFGISKMTGGGVEALTRTTAAMGSALYMSPEQMQQTRSVDHRTDIYALGVSLYEMLAGKQPFFADTLPQLCAEILTGTPTPLRTLRPDVSDHFAAVLERAYARSSAHRYQTIAEFVTALAPFAPPRTQSSIDRVCRMAGLNPPRAGAPPQSMPPAGPHLIHRASAPPVAIHESQPQLVLGHYNGPMSSGAAAAFAHVQSTNTGVSTTGGPGASSSNKPLLFVGAAVVLLALGGAGAFAVFRHNLFSTAPEAPDKPTSGGPEATSPTGAANPTAAPPATSSAAAEPPPTTEPTATAPGTSTAAATTTAAAAYPITPGTVPRGKLPVGPITKKTATPTTTTVPTRPTADVFEGR